MSTAYTAESLPNGYSPTANGAPYTNGTGSGSHSMEGRQAEYAQSDQAPAAQYSQGQDVKFSQSATPTSDYGLNPPSARSGSFPHEYIQPQRAQYPDAQRYQPASAPASAPPHAAQPTSPSLPFADGPSNHHHSSLPHHHNDHTLRRAQSASSDNAVPVDPSINTSSPTYNTHHNYPPYAPAHEMPHYQTAPHGLYPRPEYGPPPPGPYGHALPPHYGHVAQGHPINTVYSFVPIPGTAQQKRPRRRYEEIERMYKCGWNGCEKAYGTLNHLNAHVTMQSHGPKRTPEEFKEIRKEWKARKKEEESARKAEEERHRQQVVQHGGVDGHPTPDGPQPQGGYPPVRQLPPLGYAPAAGSVPPQYGHPGAPIEGMQQYSGGPVPPSYYPPQSPYQGSQVYQQRNSNPDW